jgi:hypothetical protein
VYRASLFYEFFKKIVNGYIKTSATPTKANSFTAINTANRIIRHKYKNEKKPETLTEFKVLWDNLG